MTEREGRSGLCPDCYIEQARLDRREKRERKGRREREERERGRMRDKERCGVMWYVDGHPLMVERAAEAGKSD